MNTPLIDKSPWTISTDSMAPTLEVVLAKQTLILSWNQFVYAEGSDDEVRIAFASHDVIVRGAGLSLAPACDPRPSCRVDSRVRSLRAILWPGGCGSFARLRFGGSMPTEFKKDTIPKPVGLGKGHRLATALSRLYQVIFKGSSSFRQALRIILNE